MICVSRLLRRQIIIASELFPFSFWDTKKALASRGRGGDFFVVVVVIIAVGLESRVERTGTGLVRLHTCPGGEEQVAAATWGRDGEWGPKIR